VFKTKNEKYNLDERGQVIIIVAFLIVAFVGMVALTVDVGSLYQERRHVQTVADSAALAGAQDLPEDPDQAVQTAIAYAALNGVTITEIDIVISETFVPNDTIRVNPTGIEAQLFFAPVLDINSATVNAAATAVAGTPKSMDGLMPLTIPLEDYEELEPGELYDMKVGPFDKATSGWFQAMRFDGGGSNEFRENIINGCEEEVWVGDWYPIEPGNMAGPTAQGITQRLDGDTCTFGEVVDTITFAVTNGSCPRIVFIPLIQNRPENPSEDVQVVEFAIFFIEDVEEGQESTVSGRFAKSIIAVSSGEITGYSGGIKVIRLIE